MTSSAVSTASRARRPSVFCRYGLLIETAGGREAGRKEGGRQGGGRFPEVTPERLGETRRAPFTCRDSSFAICWAFSRFVFSPQHGSLIKLNSPRKLATSNIWMRCQGPKLLPGTFQFSLATLQLRANPTLLSGVKRFIAAGTVAPGSRVLAFRVIVIKGDAFYGLFVTKYQNKNTFSKRVNPDQT